LNKIATLGLAVILLFIMANPLFGITNGQLDGSGHPYVGLVVFYVTNSTGQLEAQWRCSGSLISSRVFVTAGHCTFGAEFAAIWFTPDYLPYDPSHGYPYKGYDASGTPITMPDYRSQPLPGLVGFDYHDVGVVLLSKPYKLKTGYAMLPSQGFDDTLATKTEVTLVGYGVQYKLQVSGPPYDRWVGRTRQFVTGQLIQSSDTISAEYLKVTQNIGQDKGGTCFGDSGGPVLLGNTILAVTSFGSNANCAGVGYYNRVDTPAALAFINNP